FTPLPNLPPGNGLRRRSRSSKRNIFSVCGLAGLPLVSDGGPSAYRTGRGLRPLPNLPQESVAPATPALECGTFSASAVWLGCISSPTVAVPSGRARHTPHLPPPPSRRRAVARARPPASIERR